MAKKKSATRGPKAEAERAEPREHDRKLAADAVEQLRSSDGWKQWLAVRRTSTATASAIRS
jgi:hypothetical protein